MKREYLGDSYDAVKRLWATAFADWAPLLAQPCFVPEEIRREFQSVTRIPVLSERPAGVYCVLNDPDTGIHRPSRPSQVVTRSHASLAFIQDQLRNKRVKCVVSFDQSKSRSGQASAQQQRAEKLSWLSDNGLFGFYYVSHAPFLFAAANKRALVQARNCVVLEGIPSTRLEFGL